MPTANEQTELALIDKVTPVDLFKPEVIDPILSRIREESLAQAAKLDISTPSNRDALASLSYKIARSKTFIDSQRKSLVSDEKKRLAKIDAEGKRIWENLESLQAEIRQPLTDWENAEKLRVATHEKAIEDIPESLMFGATETSREIEYRLEYLLNLFPSRDWEEFSARAKRVIDAEIFRTQGIMVRVKAREREADELARLRAEAKDREQKEREERIAREATEKAEREASEREARLDREAKAREQAAIQAKEDAERRVRQAEVDRIAAGDLHEREKQAAIDSERKRVADEIMRSEVEAKAREKDKAHKASIHSAAVQSIAVNCYLREDNAKLVMIAIAKGLIPNVKVVY